MRLLAIADAVGQVYAAAPSRETDVDWEGYEGSWKTIRGRPVFIRDGESPAEAIVRSKKDAPRLEKEKLRELLIDRSIALSNYGQNTASFVNGRLRGRTEGGYVQTDPMIRIMDKSFATKGGHEVVKKDSEVYRFVENYGIHKTFSTLRVGSVVEDKAFLSTSHKEDLILGIGSRMNKGVVLTIKVPRGTKYLPGRFDEGERILDRSTRLKITHLTKGEDVTYATVAIVGKGVAKKYTEENSIVQIALSAPYDDAVGQVFRQPPILGVVGEDGRIVSFCYTQPKIAPLATADALGKVYSTPPLTMQIDYALIAGDLDRLEQVSSDELRSVLTVTLKDLTRQIKAGALASQLDIANAKDLHDAFRDMLRRSWDAGEGSTGQEVRAFADKEEGAWRTINGRAVFIREGESLESALDRSLGRKDEADAAVLRQSPGDADYERYKNLPHGTVIARSSRGTVETAHSAGRLHYRGRTKGGEAKPLRSTVANAKADVQNHGVANVVSGYKSPTIPWRDGPKTYAVPLVKPVAAMKWLREKAFWATGLLEDDILAGAQGILVNGLRTGAGVEGMASDLYELFSKFTGKLQDGRLTTAHRLETIVRTNTMEAYNQGRMHQFMRPDLLPFLKGFRYSAILDSRTTAVCQFLHGKVIRADDEHLSSVAPPNHFNCRALLVPVVAGEEVAKGDYLTTAEYERALELGDAKFFAENDDASRLALFYDPDQPRVPKGAENGGQWTAQGTGQAFGEAQLDGSKAAAWRKKNQKRYDVDAEFRAAIDAATLFTQGNFGKIRAIAVAEITGKLVGRWAGEKVNEKMSGSPLGEYKHYFEGQAVDAYGKGSKHTWKEGARALNDAIRTAPPLSAPIYRGVYGRENMTMLLSMKPGTTFDMAGPTSFTANRDVAERFMFAVSRGQGGGGLARGTSAVLIEVVKGARGLPVQALSPWKQQEVISSGRFRVKEIKKDVVLNPVDKGYVSRGDVVVVEQIDTFRNLK